MVISNSANFTLKALYKKPKVNVVTVNACNRFLDASAPGVGDDEEGGTPVNSIFSDYSFN